jgi:hypothetical protein
VGQVFYRDYTPVNIFNAANAQPQLESWQMLPARPYAEPQAYMDNRAGLGPWALANVQAKGYPRATEQLFFAPPEPIRRDTYMQLLARAQGHAVAASAPTGGIYTGVGGE